jgi:hypothetical protein
MNYGEFKTLVRTYIKRTDLDDLIPTWVAMAGLRIDSDCKLAAQEYRTTTPAVAQYIPLPADFIEMRNIQVDYRGQLALEYLTPEQLDNMTFQRLEGPPRFYTIFNNQVELYPQGTAESELTLELFYFAKNPDLTSDLQETKVLSQHPQLWLYAVMVEAMPFLEHESGQASWATMYRDMAEVLNTRAESARYSGNSIQMRAT